MYFLRCIFRSICRIPFFDRSRQDPDKVADKDRNDDNRHQKRLFKEHRIAFDKEIRRFLFCQVDALSPDEQTMRIDSVRRAGHQRHIVLPLEQAQLAGIRWLYDRDLIDPVHQLFAQHLDIEHVVNFKLNWIVNLGGVETDIQASLFDRLLPGFWSLVCVFGVMKLIDKKVAPIKIIYGMMLLCIILAYLHIV